jgi:hypothetical protein
MMALVGEAVAVREGIDVWADWSADLQGTLAQL